MEITIFLCRNKLLRHAYAYFASYSIQILIGRQLTEVQLHHTLQAVISKSSSRGDLREARLCLVPKSTLQEGHSYAILLKSTWLHPTPQAY